MMGLFMQVTSLAISQASILFSSLDSQIEFWLSPGVIDAILDLKQAA